ncbi:MAG: hypothetical protein Kapaf2KO_03880 [Candidatus Kapaibacteriales bacterium]
MNKSVNKYKLEESFGYLTGNAYRAINRRLKALFESEGHPITVEQFGVLVHLWEMDGICQNEISEILDKDKHNISRIVGKLEASGYLEKIGHQDDNRKKVLVLTEKGKCLEKGTKKLALKVYEECLGFAGEDSEIIKNFLRRIKNNL